MFFDGAESSFFYCYVTVIKFSLSFVSLITSPERERRWWRWNERKFMTTPLTLLPPHTDFVIVWLPSQCESSCDVGRVDYYVTESDAMTWMDCRTFVVMSNPLKFSNSSRVW